MESKSHITPNLLAGLALIRDRVKTLPKTKEGYGYRYTPLDEILDYLRPMLKEAGLVISQFPIREDGADGIATAVLSDDNGLLYSFAAFPPPIEAPAEAANMEKEKNGRKKGKPLMSPIQARGCDFTYLRRYSLCAIFNLAADEDTDGYRIGRTDEEQKAAVRAEKLKQLKARLVAHGKEIPANIDAASPETLNALWIETAEPVSNAAANDADSNAGGR